MYWVVDGASIWCSWFKTKNDRKQLRSLPSFFLVVIRNCKRHNQLRGNLLSLKNCEMSKIVVMHLCGINGDWHEEHHHFQFQHDQVEIHRESREFKHMSPIVDRLVDGPKGWVSSRYVVLALKWWRHAWRLSVSSFHHPLTCLMLDLWV